MAVRVDATTDFLSRTANLLGLPFTIMFWVQEVVESAGTQMLWILRDGSGNYHRLWDSYDLFGKAGIYSSGNELDAIIFNGNMAQGTWYWCAYAMGSDGSFSCAIDAAGGTPTWVNQSWDYYALTPTTMVLGPDGTFNGTNARYLAFKAWTSKLSTVQMEAERYWYEPQVTSGVHMWTPLIDASNDHSANGYNWTENGSITWEDYTPAGMNALQSGYEGQGNVLYELR